MESSHSYLIEDEDKSDTDIVVELDATERRRDRAAKVQRKLQGENVTENSDKKRNREEKFPLLSVVADHLEPFILHVAFATVFSGLCRCLDMLYPIYISIAIDTLRGRPPGWVLLIIQSEKETSYIVAFLTCLIVALFVIQSTLGYICTIVFTTLGEGLKHSIRMELFDKIQVREIGLKLGLKDHKNKMLQLVINDCEQLEKLLLKGLRELSQLGASLIVGVVLMLYINWKLTIIALSPCIFILFLSIFLWYKVEKLYLSTYIPDVILKLRLNNIIDHGLTEMKTHDMQISEYNRIAEASRALQTASQRMLTAKGRFTPTSNLLMLVGLSGVVAVGSFWLLTDSEHSDHLTSL